MLSHWHRDHSGGILEALTHINAARQEDSEHSQKGAVKVDLHPNRPIARGIAPPPKYDKVIARLPEDPTFREIEELGGLVDLHDEPHTVAGGTVFISGEIPRLIPFEEGLLGGVRWFTHPATSVGEWVGEPVRCTFRLRDG